MDKLDLAPCPFCPGEAVSRGNGTMYHEGEAHGCLLGYCSFTVELWNRRAAPATEGSHMPSGYMEEKDCRKCGKPVDDPIHLWRGFPKGEAPEIPKSEPGWCKKCGLGYRCTAFDCPQSEPLYSASKTPEGSEDEVEKWKDLCRKAGDDKVRVVTNAGKRILALEKQLAEAIKLQPQGSPGTREAVEAQPRELGEGDLRDFANSLAGAVSFHGRMRAEYGADSENAKLSFEHARKVAEKVRSILTARPREGKASPAREIRQALEKAINSVSIADIEQEFKARRLFWITGAMRSVFDEGVAVGLTLAIRAVKGVEADNQEGQEADHDMESAKEIIHRRLCGLYGAATSIGAQSIVSELQDAGLLHREKGSQEAAEAREAIAAEIFRFFPGDDRLDWKTAKGCDKVKHRECADRIVAALGSQGKEAGR